MTTETSTLNYYSSIKDLILYNWEQYNKTNDYNWFLIGFDGRQPKIKSDLLKEAEKNILDEYFIKINDNAILIKLRKWDEIDKLNKKYETITALLEMFYLGFGEDDEGVKIRAEYINEINSWGYKMPLINSLKGDKEEIEKVNNSIQGIKTKIEIIKDKIKSDSKTQSVNLDKEIHKVIIALQYPQRINKKEITLSEWLDLIELTNEASKNN